MAVQSPKSFLQRTRESESALSAGSHPSPPGVGMEFGFSTRHSETPEFGVFNEECVQGPGDDCRDEPDRRHWPRTGCPSYPGVQTGGAQESPHASVPPVWIGRTRSQFEEPHSESFGGTVDGTLPGLGTRPCMRRR